MREVDLAVNPSAQLIAGACLTEQQVKISKWGVDVSHTSMFGFTMAVQNCSYKHLRLVIGELRIVS